MLVLVEPAKIGLGRGRVGSGGGVRSAGGVDEGRVMAGTCGGEGEAGAERRNTGGGGGGGANISVLD